MRVTLGFTLVEVMVALALVALIAGVSGLAFASLRMPRESERVRVLREARAQAVETGRAILLGGSGWPNTPRIRFLPDGRAIGSGIDPLSGAPLDAVP